MLWRWPNPSSCFDGECTHGQMVSLNAHFKASNFNPLAEVRYLRAKVFWELSAFSATTAGFGTTWGGSSALVFFNFLATCLGTAFFSLSTGGCSAIALDSSGLFFALLLAFFCAGSFFSSDAAEGRASTEGAQVLFRDFLGGFSPFGLSAPGSAAAVSPTCLVSFISSPKSGTSPLTSAFFPLPRPFPRPLPRPFPRPLPRPRPVVGVASSWGSPCFKPSCCRRSRTWAVSKGKGEANEK